MSVGLVLEGGGMRGWYTSGVLTVLKENNISFSTVYGISAGAFNALPYLSGQISSEYVQSLLNYMSDGRCFSTDNFKTTGSIVGFDFLFGELFHKLIPFDYQAFFRSPMELKAGVTDLITGKVRFFGKADMDEDFTVIKASCSLPMASQIVNFRDFNLLDGGCSDPIPVEYSISDGNDKNVVILTRDVDYRKGPEPEYPRCLLEGKYKNYPAFINTMMHRADIYNSELETCSRLEQSGKALIVRPHAPIEFDRYENNIEKLLDLYKMGIEDAKNKLPEIKAFLGLSFS